MTPRDPASNEVVALFREILHALLMSSVPAWLDLQLTLPQLRTLFIIAHESTSSVMQISYTLGIGEPTGSHLIDKLVQAGLVERAEDLKDRRRVVVHLSSTGEELIERLLGWEELLGASLDQIPEKSLRDLRQGLRAIMGQIRSRDAIRRSEGLGR